VAKYFMKKYLKNYTLSKVTYKRGYSHFWLGLKRVKGLFLSLGVFALKNGEQIRFWEDKWLGNQSLMFQYPSLYQIVRHKSGTVANVFRYAPLNVSFRRSLVGQNLILWYNLVQRLVYVRLSTDKDCFRWNLTSSGQFTVQSMYRALINNDYVFQHKVLWNLKLPLKIKIFVWYLLKAIVLTKDNLARRNLHGNKICVFCDRDETV
jgi:hypothetical protein